MPVETTMNVRFVGVLEHQPNERWLILYHACRAWYEPICRSRI